MSRVRILFAMLISLPVFVIHAQTAAQDRYELRVPSIVEFNYDPFSGLPSSASFDIEVHSLLDDSDVKNIDEGYSDAQQEPDGADFQREVMLSIKPLNAGSFNLIGESIQLPIEFVAKNQPTIIRVAEAYEGRVLLNSNNNPSVIVELNTTVPESLFADAGEYLLELEVVLLDGETNELIVNPVQISVEVSVLQKLQTNIAGAKGRYDDGANFSVIDFGTLQSGEQRQVFIQVRGNTDADISVTSENKGRMLNTENSKLSINYTVEVDGELSELEVPLNLARSVAKDLQGSAYPMIVTIGIVKNSFAGVYQDIIHVDVSPQ